MSGPIRVACPSCGTENGIPAALADAPNHCHACGALLPAPPPPGSLYIRQRTKSGESVQGPFSPEKVREWIAIGRVGAEMSVSEDPHRPEAWSPVWVWAGMPAPVPRPAPGAGVPAAPPGPTTVRARAGARGRRSTRAASPPAPDAPDADGSDLETWLSKWAWRCGWILLGAFLLPIVLPMRRGSLWFWFTDLLDGAKGSQGAYVLVPALGGVACLVVSRAVHGASKARALLGVGVACLLVLALCTPPEVLEGAAWVMREEAGAFVILLTLGCTAVAAGNRLRKHFPGRVPPMLLATGGGILLLAVFILPFFADDPVISLLFRRRAWRTSWALTLTLLSVFAYGGVALLHFGGAETIRRAGRILSVMARCILAILPLAMLYYLMKNTGGDEGGGRVFLFVVLVMAKVLGPVYGFAFLMASALTGWVGFWMQANPAAPRTGAATADVSRTAPLPPPPRAPVPAPHVPAHAPAPTPAPEAPDLAASLTRLKALLAAGALTQEEYERRRDALLEREGL